MCERVPSFLRIVLSPSLTGRGGLARVDVSDDDDVDMSLFFTVKRIKVGQLVEQESRGS